MKILFVCSCLEPGMDGVGDYTRRLATELIGQGHSCYLLSIADSHVKQATAGEFGEERALVPYLRLPATESWAERVRLAKGFREQVAPDWVSWQIVPYGFDPRGLCFGLGGRAAEITGNCKSQVMFHEIWIGEAKGSSLKNQFIGRLQKNIIRDLLRKLRPRVAHTHTPLYQFLLGKLGQPASLLPLFGNIPLTSGEHPGWLQDILSRNGAKIDLADHGAYWIFAMFGTVHPEWNGDDFIQKATLAAQGAGKKCLLISIGRPGPAGERLLQELKKKQGDIWQICLLGQQSEEDISQCLLAADFGVSAVPPEYLFKSGTAAAMIERGLPLIATRSTYRYSNCPGEIVSIRMKNVVEGFELGSVRKTKVESLLPGVARQFIEDLQKS